MNVDEQLRILREGNIGLDTSSDDIINEGFHDKFLTKKLYHGSPFKLKTLKSTGFDLGNSFQKPGWSLFTFDDPEIAKRWATLRLVKNHRKALKSSCTKPEIFNKWTTDWDYPNKKPTISPEGFELVKNKFMGTKIYIYEMVSKLKDIGLGNDSTHNEFTLRKKDITPDKVHTITLTEKELKSIFLISNPNEMMEKVHSADSNRRGILSLFMVHDYFDNEDAAEAIMFSIKSGELTSDDDIEEFLKSKEIELKKVSLVTRFRRAFK